MEIEEVKNLLENKKFNKLKEELKEMNSADIPSLLEELEKEVLATKLEPNTRYYDHSYAIVSDPKTGEIYTPNTKGYEALKEWSRDISSKTIVHAAAQAKKQFDGNYAELRLQAQPCTPRFSVFETKTGIYEREILINASDKNIAPAC